MDRWNKVIFLSMTLAVCASMAGCAARTAQPPIEIPRFGVDTKLERPTVAAFGGKEKLVYAIKFFGVIPAGRVTLQVEEVKYDGKDCYFLSGRGRSSRFISLFRDIEWAIDSYVDAYELYPYRYEERSRRGARKESRTITYDHKSGTIRVHEYEEKPNRKEIYKEDYEARILPGIQNVLSVLYYARTVEPKEGYALSLDVNERRKNYELQLVIADGGNIRLPVGTFSAYKVTPIVEFKTRPVSAWTAVIFCSRDKRHIPLLARVKTKLGPLNIRLAEARF